MSITSHLNSWGKSQIRAEQRTGREKIETLRTHESNPLPIKGKEQK